MVKSKNKSPIDKQRESALVMEIGSDDDQSPIIGSISVGERLLIIKGGGIYEIQLADQIDPDRSNANVPNAYKRLIRYGANSEFLSRTLLMADILIDESHLVSDVSRDRLMPIVLALAIKLADLNDLVEKFNLKEAEICEALENGSGRSQEVKGFAIPEVPNLDSICKSFFIQAKHIIQDVLSIANEFFGGQLKRSYFTDLMNLAKREFGEDGEFFLFLKDTNQFCQFIREARNCFEHDNPDKRAIVSNVRMNSSAQIVLPTFELIHPEYPQKEVGVGFTLNTIFQTLVEFSETTIAHLVKTHLDKSDRGFRSSLLYFPEGHGTNPNVRYGFGVTINGELRPLG